MASSDSHIDQSQRGHPKRAELSDLNTNTGAKNNIERASLGVPTRLQVLPFLNMCLKYPYFLMLINGYQLICTQIQMNVWQRWMAVTTNVKTHGEVIGVLVIVDMICLPIKRPAQVSLPFYSANALFCYFFSLSLGKNEAKLRQRVYSMS